jgi:DNA-binding HxlR family transcriptional regulator
VPIRHTYAEHGDACAAAHAMDVVGDRWAVIVIRELMLGPKRFSDLLAGMLGATPTVLTARLRDLERAGVVDRVELAPPARVPVYRLTEWGLEFQAILQALGQWAQRSPTRPADGYLTPDAAILAMCTMADGPSPRTSLAFDLGLHDHRDPKLTRYWYRIAWGPDPLSATKYDSEVTTAEALVCSSETWTNLLFSPEHKALLTSPAVTARGRGTRIAKAFLSHFQQGQ